MSDSKGLSPEELQIILADPLVPSAWTPEITTYAPPKREGAPQ